MKKVFALIFYTFLFINLALSQTANDSLYALNFDELEKIVYSFEENENENKNAKLVSDIFIQKAISAKDSIRIAHGFYLNYRQDYSIQHLDSIIHYSINNPSKQYPAYAYFAKAQIYLYDKRDITKTLNNIDKARRYLNINTNIELKYRVNYLVGIIKSEHLDENEDALKIYKQCETYYKNKEEKKYKARYLHTLHAIAETYIDLKKYDSTSYYNQLGYFEATKSDDPYLQKNKAYFILCEGLNKYINKQYTAAIDSIHKALPTILKSKDISNTIDSYFYLGKSHYDMKNPEKAILYLKKTDSILETLNSIPQFKHLKIYEYLKNHYNNINDFKNQIKYLNKLTNALSNYHNNQIVINKKIKKNYDLKLLKEELEILEKKSKKNNTNYISSLLILIILLVIISILYYHQYRKKLTYRKRFDDLIQSLESNPPNNNTIITPKKQAPKNNTKELQVPKKHVDYILEKLNEFETEKKFLSIGITAQSLADEIETNVKYLSRVINHYKDQTFSTYINELRINYAVKELQENVMLRKFTIKAIANEFGYSRSETFSNAFYKQVKIKPSYYIKQLSKSTS